MASTAAAAVGGGGREARETATAAKVRMRRTRRVAEETPGCGGRPSFIASSFMRSISSGLEIATPKGIMSLMTTAGMTLSTSSRIYKSIAYRRCRAGSARRLVPKPRERDEQ